MPRTCVICTDRRRKNIDAALLDGLPYRGIARQYGVSPSALWRHRVEHVRQSIERARAADEILLGDALVDHVPRWRARTERLYAQVENLLGEAVRAKDSRAALDAVRSATAVIQQAHAGLKLLGQMSGELQAPLLQVQVVVPVRSGSTAGFSSEAAVDIGVPRR
jgi:transposase-like protein